MKKTFQIVLAVGFLVAATSPMLYGSLVKNDGSRLSENRTMAAMPAAPNSWDEALTFPSKFDSFMSDNFGFRDQLIYAYNYIMTFVMHKSPSDKVILGDDGWLFVGYDGVRDSWTGAWRLSEQEVDAWTKPIVERKEWLENRGIPFLLAIPPEKHWIYSQYLPAHQKRGADPSVIDQLIGALERKGVDVLDLREVLSKAAAEASEPIYYKHDTHWNQLGALIAAKEIVSKAASLVSPGAEMDVDWDTEVRVEERPRTGDLAVMLGLAEHFSEVAPFVSVSEPERVREKNIDYLLPVLPNMKDRHLPKSFVAPAAPLPSSLIFRDSFAIDLMNPLKGKFQQSVFIWDNRYQSVWPKTFDGSLVERINPSIFVQESSERMLYLGTGSNALVPMSRVVSPNQLGRHGDGHPLQTAVDLHVRMASESRLSIKAVTLAGKSLEFRLAEESQVAALSKTTKTFPHKAEVIVTMPPLSRSSNKAELVIEGYDFPLWKRAVVVAEDTYTLL